MVAKIYFKRQDSFKYLSFLTGEESPEEFLGLADSVFILHDRVLTYINGNCGELCLLKMVLLRSVPEPKQ